MTARANFAIKQVLAAARLLSEEGYPAQARALRAIVCDYQEDAARRPREELTRA